MTEQQAKDATVETWWYAGRRMHGKTLVDAWWPSNVLRDTLLLFKADKQVRGVGSAYLVRVLRHEDGGISMVGKPGLTNAPLEGRPSQGALEQWRVQHSTTLLEVERERKERKLALDNDDISELTVREMREHYFNCRSRRERDALVAMVLGSICVGR